MKKQAVKITMSKIGNSTMRSLSMKNAHKTPVMQPTRNGWVQFGNDPDWKNNFPGYLIELFNRSPNHGAIVEGKKLLMMGKGWDQTDYKPNADESLNAFTEKFIMDDELFNGAYIEVIPNRLFNGVAEIRHLPFQNVRANYQLKCFYYSEQFGSRDVPADVVEFERWKPGQPFMKGKRYLYLFRRYRSGVKTYTLPNYMQALADIETDVEISNFNLNEIKNNFTGGKLVSVYGGIPTDEERKAFEGQFSEDYTGTDNAGRFIFSWSDTRERNVDVSNLQGDDLDKRYIELNKVVQQKIFTAHKVTSPMLFGIKTEGQLGGRQELEDAYELFKNIYIDPRKTAIEECINILASAMGYGKPLKIIEADPVGSTQATPSPSISGNTTVTTTDATPPATFRQQFNHDPKKLISIFSRYGRKRDEFEVLESIPNWREAGVPIELTEYRNKEKFATTKISEDEAAVLDLLKKDPLTQLTSIAVALDMTVEDVQAIVQNLFDKKLIKESKGGGLSPSAKGSRALNGNPPSTTDIYIVYHYDVAPGLGDLLIPTSREFCRDLVGMNKVFSRKDIEDVSQEYGYDVWELRGGYYHNPKDGETTPYCRHIWTQEIVTEKK